MVDFQYETETGGVRGCHDGGSSAEQLGGAFQDTVVSDSPRFKRFTHSITAGDKRLTSPHVERTPLPFLSICLQFVTL